jgi:SUMO ligase MMS21 Smc5/6 complex component
MRPVVADTMLKEEAAADIEDSRYKQAAADFVENDDFPIELICPITHTLIYDPVLTVQGNVYERAAITEWLQTHTTGQ